MVADRFGFDGSVNVFVYVDLEKLLQAYTGFRRLPLTDQVRQFWASTGGYADQNFVFINAALTSSRAPFEHTVAHEFFHIVESYLAKRPISGSSSVESAVGPVWLFEGGADFFAVQVASEEVPSYAASFRQSSIANARSIGVGLERFETWDSSRATGGNPYAIGFVAVELLVDRLGEDAVLNYFKQISLSSGWRDAFQKAFGLSVSEFYQIFNPYKATVR